MDKIERNLETALKNLEELNLKVDKLANEVSELRQLQNPKVLKGDSSAGTKNSNALSSLIGKSYVFPILEK